MTFTYYFFYTTQSNVIYTKMTARRRQILWCHFFEIFSPQKFIFRINEKPLFYPCLYTTEIVWPKSIFGVANMEIKLHTIEDWNFRDILVSLNLFWAQKSRLFQIPEKINFTFWTNVRHIPVTQTILSNFYYCDFLKKRV